MVEIFLKVFKGDIMKITLRELYEYNKKCIIDELWMRRTVCKDKDKEYMIDEIPTKEDFINEFESSILSPWGEVIDNDVAYAEKLLKECNEEIGKVYDEVIRIRETFISK